MYKGPMDKTKGGRIEGGKRGGRGGGKGWWGNGDHCT